MIQQFLTKYAVALHIAVIGAFALSCLLVGPVAGAPFFWLTFIAMECAMLLPATRHEESLMEARSRVLQTAGWNPLFYLLLVFVSLYLIEGWNGGCSLEYDATADTWGMGSPKILGLPFAVKSLMGYKWAAIVFAVLASCLIIQEGVSRKGKRLILQTVSVASGVTALIGSCYFLHDTPETQSKLAESAFQTAGICFGFWAIVATGLYSEMAPRGKRLKGAVLFFGIVCNTVGLLLFADPLMLSVTVIFLVIAIAYSIFTTIGAVDKKEVMKTTVVLTLVIGAIVFLLAYAVPDNPFVRKLAVLKDIDLYFKNYFADRGMRAGLALQIFQDNAWFGVGAEGFGSYVGLYLAQNSAEWSTVVNNSGCVLNDYLQLLCEGGVVGTLLVGAALVVLLVPICNRLRILVQSYAKSRLPGKKTEAAIEVTPLLLPSLLSMILIVIGAGLGNPCMEPSVLFSVGCLMACLPSFLPDVVPLGESGLKERSALSAAQEPVEASLPNHAMKEMGIV